MKGLRHRKLITSFKVSQQLLLAVTVACLILLSGANNAACEGWSTEDLVGVFSIEKTIKLGQGSCQPSQDPFAEAMQTADTLPPRLADLKLDPDVTDTRTLNLTARIIDDSSGLSGSNAIWFTSPSGAYALRTYISPANLTSGSADDGIYRSVLEIPEGYEKGVWLLKNMTLTDAAGNSALVTRNDLILQGMPLGFMVV